MTYAVWCPNCDHKLWIEEFTGRYAILDKYNGHPIDKCPNCDTRLKVENGILKEDKS